MIRFRPDVEGLRAVAVLLVIANHLGLDGFHAGFIGVDVFFVISGYLITSLLATEYRQKAAAARGLGSISIVGFYARRARRILPASLVVIVAVVVASHLLLNELRVAEIRHDAIWAALFASNVNLINQATDYFSQGLAVSPLQHYWSLAVEEQFYLVWPALFLLVTKAHGLRIAGRSVWWERRVGLTIAIVGITSFVWSVSATTNDPASAYFSSLTRSWELALGALIGIATTRATRLHHLVGEACSAAGVATLVAACIVIDETTAFPGTAALLPTVAAALIILGGIADSPPLASRVLGLAPMRFVGKVSYSLYLWHWPVIVFAVALYPDTAETTNGKLAIVVVSFAISVASFYAIERPFRRIKIKTKAADRRRSRRALHGVVRRGLYTVGGLAIGGAIVAVVVSSPKGDATVAVAKATSSLTTASGLVNDSPAPPAVPPGSQAFDQLAEPGHTAQEAWSAKIVTGLQLQTLPDGLRPLSSHLAGFETPCQGGVAASQPGTCSVGDPTARPRVALVGDSHAAMFLPAVSIALRHSSPRIELFWLGWCGWATNDGKGKHEAGCPEFHRKTFARLTAWRPDVVILAEDAGRTGESMASALASFSSVARRIVVLTHTPAVPGFETCLSGTNDISRCTGTYSRDSTGMEFAASENVKATVIDTSVWFCIDGRCPSVIDGTAVFTDGSHLTAEFGPKLGPLLREALANAHALPA